MGPRVRCRDSDSTSGKSRLDLCLMWSILHIDDTAKCLKFCSGSKVFPITLFTSFCTYQFGVRFLPSTIGNPSLLSPGFLYIYIIHSPSIDIHLAIPLKPNKPQDLPHESFLSPGPEAGSRRQPSINWKFDLTMGLENQANNSGNIINVVMYIQYCLTHTYSYTYTLHTCGYLYTHKIYICNRRLRIPMKKQMAHCRCTVATFGPLH